ncbi:MAG: cupin domain-containing protein [Solirubrobacterales bacterium]
MPNIFNPDFDQKRDHDGFTRERAFIGRQAGAERLGASIWVIEPGDAAYPYHFHYGEEEMLIVLEGAPSLRTPEGWRELERGAVVSCLVGEAGAHQLKNNTDSPARILAISTVEDVDTVIYPDSGKTGVYFRRGKPDEYRGLFKHGTEVDYWDGEG